MKKSDYSIIDQILVPHTSFINYRRRIELLFNAAEFCEDPGGIAIIGESRSGKSRLLQHIEGSHQRLRRDDGMYIPILRITTPAKPTVRGLAQEFLRAIGDPLWRTKDTEQERTDRLKILLQQAGTRMIFIDEFHHFFDKASHTIQHHVSDWLKILIDETKLALVVSGLPSCMSIINQNEQLRGRFTGVMEMPRFDWEKQASQLEFISILEAFQTALSDYELPNMTSEGFAFRMYCASGGLMGYVTKILRQAIWRAISMQTTIIGLDDLAVAYEEAIWTDRFRSDFNPFDLRFDSTPNLLMLASAKEVGLATIEDQVMQRSGRKARAKKQSVSEILSSK